MYNRMLKGSYRLDAFIIMYVWLCAICCVCVPLSLCVWLCMVVFVYAHVLHWETGDSPFLSLRSGGSERNISFSFRFPFPFSSF